MPIGLVPRIGVEALGNREQFLTGKHSESFEPQDEVIVVSHNGEFHDLTEVQAGVVVDESQQLIGILLDVKGIVAGWAGNLSTEMVKTVRVDVDLAWHSWHARSFLMVDHSNLY